MKLLLTIMLLFLVLTGGAWAQTLVPPFPGSPTANQEVIGPDGQTYRWDGTKWVHATGTPALIADAALASAYSGVGNCPASEFVNALTRNAAPTCAPVNFSGVTLNNSTFTGTVTLPAASIADAALANGYSGIGACTAGSAAIQLHRNAAPTCSPFLPVNNPTYTGLLTGPRVLLTDSNVGVLFNSATTPRASITASGRSVEITPNVGTLQIAAGGHFNGTVWIADAPNPSMIEPTSGGINFFADLGQTVGGAWGVNKLAALIKSNWPAHGGGFYMWENLQNGVAPLIQVQNLSDPPNNNGAAAGFNAIALKSGILPADVHNFWMVNRGPDFTGAGMATDKPDSAYISTQDLGGLVISTYNDADIWVQSGMEEMGPVGNIWMATGNAGGMSLDGRAAGGGTAWFGFAPGWGTAMQLRDRAMFVNHLHNTHDAAVPFLDQGATLEAGSRDTFGRAVAGPSNTFNMWFGMPFTGTPICVLTDYGMPYMWIVHFSAPDAVGFTCYDLNGGPCPPYQHVAYICGNLGG